MKKYRVIERFTVDLISEVEAENRIQAQVKHDIQIGSLVNDEYGNECDKGAGDSTYEIKEIS